MAYLIVESGSNQGQQFEIHDEAVIGRHSSCDIVLAAAGMSRRQCRLFEDGGCYVVEDMKSRNGTFVNGEQVRGTRRLATNDIVNVSHYSLRFIEYESTTEETTYANSFILDARSVFPLFPGAIPTILWCRRFGSVVVAVAESDLCVGDDAVPPFLCIVVSVVIRRMPRRRR
jgi:hypothetical protein